MLRRVRNLNEIETLPLLSRLDRRGGCGIKKYRAATLTPQTGWWFKYRRS